MSGGGNGQSVQPRKVHQCTQSTFIAIDRFARGVERLFDRLRACRSGARGGRYESVLAYG